MRSLAVTLAFLATVSSSLVAQRKGCGATTIPKTLPLAHEIVDSAAVIAELDSFHKLADQMLFSLVYTPADSFPEVSPLLGGDEQASLVLLRSIWPQKPTGTWALRVAIVHDSANGTSSLTLERSIYCPPEPERTPTSAMPTRILFQAQPGDHRPAATQPGVRERRVHYTLDCTVDEAGNVTKVDMTESSGFAELDRIESEQWQARKFKPALIDGVPIRAVFRVGGMTPRM